MNLWNSPTCSLSPLPLFLLLSLAGSNPLFWFVSFYLYPYSFPPSVWDCPCVFLFSPVLSLSACSFLPLFLHFTVSQTSKWIQFKSYPENREQQQDFVNGNLIRGEQGVCNAVHVPGSCLITFGFVQIWWLLTCRERKNYTERDSWLIFHCVL